MHGILTVSVRLVFLRWLIYNRISLSSYRLSAVGSLKTHFRQAYFLDFFFFSLVRFQHIYFFFTLKSAQIKGIINLSYCEQQITFFFFLMKTTHIV